MFEHRELLVREQHGDLQQSFAVFADSDPGDYRGQCSSAGWDDNQEHGYFERDEPICFAGSLNVYCHYSRVLNVLIADAPFALLRRGRLAEKGWASSQFLKKNSAISAISAISLMGARKMSSICLVQPSLSGLLRGWVGNPGLWSEPLKMRHI